MTDKTTLIPLPLPRLQPTPLRLQSARDVEQRRCSPAAECVVAPVELGLTQ
jgi:hypothetical protein